MMNHDKRIPIPSRKKAVIFNSLAHYMGIILMMVQGVVLVPLYLKYIDSRLYGAWLATGNIIAYLGLLDFGFYSIIVQKVARMAGERDEQHLGGLIGTSMIISSILAVLPLAIGSMLCHHLPTWINVQGADALQLEKAILAASASTSLMFFAYSFGGILVGLQWVGVVSWQYVLSNVLGIVATIIFLLTGWGVVSIAMGLLVRAVFLSLGHVIYLFLWVKRYLPKRSLRFDKKVFAGLFRGSLWIFVSRLSNTLGGQSDHLIVSTVIDPRLTTVLALTKKASEVVALILMRIPSSFMPGMAHLAGETDQAKLRTYMIGLLKFVSLMSLWGMGGMLLSNGIFVKLWVGAEYYGGLGLTVLIGISYLVLIFNTVLYHHLFAVGEIPLTAKAALLEAFIRIPVSIALCYLWGIQGVVLAGIFAALPSTVFMQVRRFLKILNVSWRKLIPSLLIFLCKSCVPMVMGLVVRLFWHLETWMEFFAFLTVYFLSAMAFYALIDKDFKNFFSKAIKKFSLSYEGFLQRSSVKTGAGFLGE